MAVLHRQHTGSLASLLLLLPTEHIAEREPLTSYDLYDALLELFSLFFPLPGRCCTKGLAWLTLEKL